MFRADARSINPFFASPFFIRNILATIDRLFAQMTQIADFSEAVCNNPVLLRLLRIRDYLIRTTVPDHVPQRRDEARGWRC